MNQFKALLVLSKKLLIRLMTKILKELRQEAEATKLSHLSEMQYAEGSLTGLQGY